MKEAEVAKRRAEMGDRHAAEIEQAGRAYTLEQDLQARGTGCGRVYIVCDVIVGDVIG